MTHAEHHLQAPAAGPELHRRSVRSAVLQLATQVAQIAMLVGSGMTLARLLTPRDFGLVAMVTAVSTFFLTFRDFGFNLAAIQREELNHEQASALFWMHLRLTIGASLFVAALGPALAWFYGEPALVPIAIVLAAGVTLMGVGTLQEGVLIRQMRVPVVMVAELAAMFVSVAVAIGAALLGAGLWSLVLQFVVLGAVRSGILWRISRWRPARPGAISDASRDGYRALLAYGGRYTGARVLEYIARHLDRVLVGYLSGAAVLGLYENAARWSHYPVLHLQVPLARVAVSGLSRVQTDGPRFLEASRRGLLPVFALMVPTLAFMAVSARDVILFLLGDQWLGAVPLFRILCVAGIAVSLARSAMWLYLARGDTARQLRWALVQTPLVIAAVVIGTRWGAVGVAASFAIANWVLLVPGLSYCLATSPVSAVRYLAIAGRPLLASTVAAATLMLLGHLLADLPSLLVRLAGSTVIFATAYFVAWVILPGGRRALGDVIGLAALLRGPALASSPAPSAPATPSV